MRRLLSLASRAADFFGLGTPRALAVAGLAWQPAGCWLACGDVALASCEASAFVRSFWSHSHCARRRFPPVSSSSSTTSLLADHSAEPRSGGDAIQWYALWFANATPACRAIQADDIIVFRRGAKIAEKTANALEIPSERRGRPFHRAARGAGRTGAPRPNPRSGDQVIRGNPAAAGRRSVAGAPAKHRQRILSVRLSGWCRNAGPQQWY